MAQGILPLPGPRSRGEGSMRIRRLQFPIGQIRRQIERDTPARKSDFEPREKPAADESPYRSAEYVHPRHSADGNSYAPGEPIPFEEALRQGQIDPAGERVRNFRVPSCPRCKGSGKRGQPKGHQPNCQCPFCRPCSACGGSGFISTIKEESHASSEEEGGRSFRSDQDDQ